MNKYKHRAKYKIWTKKRMNHACQQLSSECRQQGYWFKFKNIKWQSKYQKLLFKKMMNRLKLGIYQHLVFLNDRNGQMHKNAAKM